MSGLALLVLACVGLGGLVVGRGAWPTTRMSRLAAAFLVGGVGVAALLVAAALVGVPLRASAGVAFALGAPLGLHWLWRLRARPREDAPRWTPIERAGLVVWLILVAAMLRNVAAVPMASVDGRTLWWLHARLIHDASTYPSPEHRDPGFPLPHPQYPPLLPVLEATAAAFGAPAESLMRTVPFLFYLALGGLLIGELPRRDPRAGRGLALAVLLLPTLVFSEEGGADAGVADTTVATYVVAAALALEAGAAPLAGLLAAGGALTKNEGLVLGLLLCVSAWLRRGEARRSLRPALTLAAVFAAIVIPWLLVRATLPAGFDERYLARLTPEALVAGVPRAPMVLWEMLRIALLHPQRSGLFWWAMAALWLLGRSVGPERGGGRRLVLPAYLAIVLVLYIVSPWEGVTQVQLSFERVLIQLAPLFALALAARGPAPERSQSV